MPHDMNARILAVSLIAAALAAPAFGRQPPAAAAAAPAKPALAKGMSAEEIVKIVGQPDSVRPLENSVNVKAEVWTYRRLMHEEVRETATNTSTIPTYVGPMGGGPQGMGSVPSLEYKLERVRTYQVTALLMVDGRLTMARQWKEQERHYDS